MTEKKTEPSKRGKKKKKSDIITSILTAIFISGGAGLAWFIYTKKTEQNNKLMAEQKQEADELRALRERRALEPPSTLVNGSEKETVKAAAKLGWKPCPGACLKLSTPGWQHKDVAGHSPEDYWFTFYHQGGTTYYSQRHVGHIIKVYYDRRAMDEGPCPVCNGVGWVRITPASQPANGTTSKGKARKS